MTNVFENDSSSTREVAPPEEPEPELFSEEAEPCQIGPIYEKGSSAPGLYGAPVHRAVAFFRCILDGSDGAIVWYALNSTKIQRLKCKICIRSHYYIYIVHFASNGCNHSDALDGLGTPELLYCIYSGAFFYNSRVFSIFILSYKYLFSRAFHTSP